MYINYIVIYSIIYTSYICIYTYMYICTYACVYIIYLFSAWNISGRKLKKCVSLVSSRGKPQWLRDRVKEAVFTVCLCVPLVLWIMWVSYIHKHVVYRLHIIFAHDATSNTPLSLPSIFPGLLPASLQVGSVRIACRVERNIRSWTRPHHLWVNHDLVSCWEWIIPTHPSTVLLSVSFDI